MLTKNGICLKLEESEYKAIKNGLVFYFSSKFYLKKFLSSVNNYIDNETLKLKTKYGINANFEMYLSLALYQKIEKRGFYVYDDIMKCEIKPDIVFINVIRR